MGEAKRGVRSKSAKRKQASPRTPLLLAGLVVALIVGILVVVNASSSGSGYADVDPSGLATMLEEEDVTLVNVHVPYEGEIPETDAFIPFDDVASYTEDLPEDKDATIVVYCRTGNMSVEASNALVDLGYTNVFNLEGGFVGWGSEGYELR
jgi:rhodanese-related sulfurtransferase